MLRINSAEGSRLSGEIPHFVRNDDPGVSFVIESRDGRERLDKLRRLRFTRAHRRAVGVVDFHRAIFFQHRFDFVRVADRDHLQRFGI